VGPVLYGCATERRAPVADSTSAPKEVPVDDGAEYARLESELSHWTLREKIGQLLIIGYRDDKQITELAPGGVALFSWSMKNATQTRELTTKLRALAKQKLKAPLLISTDHEGGRVIRLREGMTRFPEASAIGTANDRDLAFRVGKAVGEELAYLGIDANFAPVLDLGGTESFLGNRLWGQDPRQVGEMTGAYIQGLQDSGVVSVAKHFPGHGPSGEDAHFSVPVNHKTLQALWSEDFRPFQQAVLEKVPAMMTAHVRVPEVDRLPASMSSRFLSRILRDTFKFEGVIVTDDLEMKGAQESTLSPGDLALQALIAGSDMLLIVWSKEDQRAIVARIERAISRGEWSEAELDRKLMRILKLKSRWVGGERWQANHVRSDVPLRSRAHLDLVDEINAKPLTWLGEQALQLREAFAKAKARPWRVALPKGPYAAYWKSLRPSDEIFVHERRLNSATLKLLKEKFSATECQARACLVLTEAVAQTSMPFYEYVKSLVKAADAGTALKSPASVESATSGGGLLWAHMGLAPQVERAAPNTAVVVLGASGLPRFRQLSLVLDSK
jgi:beta-N-acetylhexosaminidase